MAAKSGKRIKHIPQRTCVGCRQVLPKRSLIRVVRVDEAVFLDASGKAAGRGAYLHNKRSCWEKGLKGPLEHALRKPIKPEDLSALKQFSATLPEDDENAI